MLGKQFYFSKPSDIYWSRVKGCTLENENFMSKIFIFNKIALSMFCFPTPCLCDLRGCRCHPCRGFYPNR